MQILILGGTGWLGREITRQALDRGHRLTCLARGETGAVAEGATLVRADRSEPDAYAEVVDRDWDGVIEVSWQPGFVRAALAALAPRTRHWTYVSSASVYADTDVIDADESASTLPALAGDTADREFYGQAKVACEQACIEAIGDRVLIARSGLIGGPGDPSDRAGYWVARAAQAPQDPLLVPTESGVPSQVIDVRDLANWLLDCIEGHLTGTFNTVGPLLSFEQWVALSREIGGHTGEVVRVPGGWLLDHEVDWFMGPESVALWLATAGDYGFASRSNAAAERSGLRHRPARELLADLLADERARGLGRPRQAGLSAARERELIAAYLG